MNARAIPVLRPLSDARHGRFVLDSWLLGVVLALLVLGLVMVASASISIAERQTGQPFYYFWRQTLFVVIGLLTGALILRIRLVYWERLGPVLLLFGLVLLVAVLGLGREINGSTRWLGLGLFNLQPSELMKLFIVVYLAGYLVRRGEEVRSSVKGFLKPMLLVGLIGGLLLAEPDFGAAVVITATVLGMMFLGGVRLWQFGVLFAGTLGAAAVLVLATPYRMARLTSFADPWADPFDSGFQLTQALIAFGRGEWGGVGLGGSVQKLFYLPEAHTDFLFAVLAEELGLVGVLMVVGLFALLVWRAFVIGRRAQQAGSDFGAYLSYGLGLWLGMQAFINLGVNMGVLPTKGLTLPLMSYGGSSIVVTCMACTLLLRVSHEYPLQKQPLARRVVRESEQKHTPTLKRARRGKA
ncbi:MAG TPA: putative lipid II flippase FtsW [Gammaproteobacteria bacterium]|nr:putative lipid II flippase FtsW [Gammaproteobacteria bacterium]